MTENNNTEIISKVEDVDLEKQELFEKERQEILNSAVSGRIGTIKEKVAFILNCYYPARNSDIELAWIYWETFEKEILKNGYITKEELFNLTKISSLSRIRAKIQNEYKLFQADDNVKRFRGVLEGNKKNEAIEDKPELPFYFVFIDETGKTQDYLSVGSLWLTSPGEIVSANFDLRSWKRNQGIDFEFHFAELSKHRLDLYKEFFLKFLSLHPTCGFKVIILNKAGITNVNNAFTDLTFHLINKGIEHEHLTGRAILPRNLQINIDNEEAGNDKLKIENLKERIISQNIVGLYLDSFEAINSIDNMNLQAVDLFISSINRKLHFPINKDNHPKDELADYILNLLHFNISSLDFSNNVIDKSTIFNLTR